MLDLFHRGGPVMYPLLLSSILATAIFLERLWSLRFGKIVPQPFTSLVLSACSSGDVDGALKKCDTWADSPMRRIVKAGLLHLGAGSETIRFMITENGNQEAARLEKNQRVLATVAYVAPLLGLLGTVSGMIKAFETIASHSVGDPSMLAAGISEALITTAAGLSVAIPVVIMHRFIQGRASMLSLALERESVVLAEHLMRIENGTCSQREHSMSESHLLTIDRSRIQRPDREDHVD
ncbi:MAG: MotA/TolQ/ExbB proton channel family protein [Desulfomonilaceae bacterium]|nr:MotA/TolQ/ExbB proton channel family protein [Desulfomonilaceae bacterium]